MKGCKNLQGNGERTSSLWFPNILLIVIMFTYNSDLLRHQIRGIETYSKLTNHRNISSGLQGFHKLLGTGLSNCSKVVNKICLGHTNSRVLYHNGLLLLVGLDLDAKVWVTVQYALVCKRLVSNLIKSIGSIWN